MADKALSFQWQTDADALPFLGAAAFDVTVRSIVIEAYLSCLTDPEQWISYSRNKNFYRRSRYRRTIYTYATVIRTVDVLAREGWLEHRKASQGSLGRQSTFRASPKLMAVISPAIAIALETVEPIVLRDRADKGRVEYRDTRETIRMRRHLDEINEALSSIEISHPALGIIRPGAPTRIEDANPGPAQQTLSRVFNGTFGHGGRFYGGFWIGMKGKERVRLTINGQETIERDYKAIHPTLLYAEAGTSFDGDPYGIPGYPTEFRKLIKIAFNTMVNASARSGAAWSVFQRARVLTDAGTIPVGCCSLQAINALLDAIEARHGRIRRAFYSDAGIRLQRTDSDLTENVVLNLTRQSIATLPVHDSFITEKQHSNRLEEVMDKALKLAMKSPGSETGFSRLISVSNQREISPRDLHTASDLHNGREAPTLDPPEPTPSLALAWVWASFLPPPYGLALVLGVSGDLEKIGRIAQIRAAA